MNFSQLKHIIEIEKTGSISRAAANLSMNQPHLSKSVRELEDSLGVTLFYRSSRGVIPTEQGTKVLEYAKKILVQAAEIENICREGSVSKVLLSISAPRAAYVLHAFAEFVRTLDEAIPVSIDYREEGALETIAFVGQRQGSLGIIRFPAEREKYYANLLKAYSLVSEPLWNFEHIVLISHKSPFADCERLTAEQLSACIEITAGDGREEQKNVNGEWELSNSRISVREQAAGLELLDRLPNSFMWASPMPREIMRRYGLVQKRFAAPRGLYRDVLITREDYSPSDIDKRFTDKLRSTVFELQLN